MNSFRDIHWTQGQPDGGKAQNYMGIRVREKSFNDLDFDGDSEVCVACEVERSAVFTLRGTCKYSYLDTEYYPTLCGGYIGFIGNTMSIWYNI